MRNLKVFNQKPSHCPPTNLISLGDTFKKRTQYEPVLIRMADPQSHSVIEIGLTYANY